MTIDPSATGNGSAASAAPLWVAFLALCEQATRDALTGLYNRRYFDDTLADHVEAATRYGRPLALVLFDLDRFKRINDEQGHAAGDAALKTFAQVLQSAARKADIACRIGGDEFAVILPETNRAGAARLAERVLRALRGERGTGVPPGDATPPSATAGIAALPCENLFAVADAELRAGKNAR